LLQRPEIARPNAVVICFAAALFASVLYLPLYLQIGHGLGIGAPGTLLLPITLSMVTAATFTGRLVSRTGKVTIFPMIGLTLATSALIALGVTITFASIALVLFLTGITGVGLGMVMPPMQVAVQQAAGRESLGAAIGSMSLCRSIGGAIGVAMIGAIIFLSIGRAAGLRVPVKDDVLALVSNQRDLLGLSHAVGEPAWRERSYWPCEPSISISLMPAVTITTEAPARSL